LSSSPLQPCDLDFAFDRFELRIARDELGFPLLRQRHRKGVGEAELVAALEVGGEIRKRARGGLELDRQRWQLARDLLPAVGAALQFPAGWKLLSY
jgi:hypothetical protein